MSQTYPKLGKGGLDESAEFCTVLGMAGGAHLNANVVANCAKLLTEGVSTLGSRTLIGLTGMY